MKTEWDYTELADAYLKRPDYAEEAINKMMEIAGVFSGGADVHVCDVGAGAAHLTLHMARKGLTVQEIQSFSGRVVHEVPVEDVIEGWRSHGTLHRQVGDKFGAVVDDIAAYLHGLGKETIPVPYETHIWMARVIK